MLTGTSELRRHLSFSVKLLSLRINGKFVLILINTLFPMDGTEISGSGDLLHDVNVLINFASWAALLLVRLLT